MKRILIVGVLAIAGCATKPTVTATLAEPSGFFDGVDIWTGGTPARAYQVIGTVEKVGPDNSATYEQEEELIAQDAKKRGADGIIVLSTVMVPVRQDLFGGRAIMGPKVEAEVIKYQ